MLRPQGRPSFHNLVNTLRENVTVDCLHDREKMFNQYFEKFFIWQGGETWPSAPLRAIFLTLSLMGLKLNSSKRQTFFTLHYFSFFCKKVCSRYHVEHIIWYICVPQDTDSTGKFILKSKDIANGKYNQAMILPSDVQIRERQKLVNDKCSNKYDIKKKYYNAEQNNKELNEICKGKLSKIICKAYLNYQYCHEYKLIQSHLTLVALKENSSHVLCNELLNLCLLRSIQSTWCWNKVR